MSAMKKSELSLNVEERLLAALHLKTMENQEKACSVSELCRIAGVSRATLYQHHPALLAEIRLRLEVRTKSQSVESKSERKAKSTSLEPHIKSLLYLCLELQMEVRSLKALIPRSGKK